MALADDSARVLHEAEQRCLRDGLARIAERTAAATVERLHARMGAEGLDPP